MTRASVERQTFWTSLIRRGIDGKHLTLGDPLGESFGKSVRPSAARCQTKHLARELRCTANESSAAGINQNAGEKTPFFTAGGQPQKFVVERRFPSPVKIRSVTLTIASLRPLTSNSLSGCAQGCSTTPAFSFRFFGVHC